ncbi:hypothetical protein TNCT_191221 [Trichonephila clavata]|uniref:Uncharacterized protein n=1 Tax=Trichonephila clavata TaxID=2740835 RepID=A0A8X6KZX6_TRICU|nr:hypothetical protein TNCT_191221 [Trichonephila clavata]
MLAMMKNPIRDQISTWNSPHSREWSFLPVLEAPIPYRKWNVRKQNRPLGSDSFLANQLHSSFEEECIKIINGGDHFTMHLKNDES